jgi:hypothetical protein
MLPSEAGFLRTPSDPTQASRNENRWRTRNEEGSSPSLN